MLLAFVVAVAACVDTADVVVCHANDASVFLVKAFAVHSGRVYYSISNPPCDHLIIAPGGRAIFRTETTAGYVPINSAIIAHPAIPKYIPYGGRVLLFQSLDVGPTGQVDMLHLPSDMTVLVEQVSIRLPFVPFSSLGEDTFDLIPPAPLLTDGHTLTIGALAASVDGILVPSIDPTRRAALVQGLRDTARPAPTPTAPPPNITDDPPPTCAAGMVVWAVTPAVVFSGLILSSPPSSTAPPWVWAANADTDPLAAPPPPPTSPGYVDVQADVIMAVPQFMSVDIPPYPPTLARTTLLPKTAATRRPAGRAARRAASAATTHAPAGAARPVVAMRAAAAHTAPDDWPPVVEPRPVGDGSDGPGGHGRHRGRGRNGRAEHSTARNPSGTPAAAAGARDGTRSAAAEADVAARAGAVAFDLRIVGVGWLAAAAAPRGGRVAVGRGPAAPEGAHARRRACNLANAAAAAGGNATRTNATGDEAGAAEGVTPPPAVVVVRVCHDVHISGRVAVTDGGAFVVGGCMGGGVVAEGGERWGGYDGGPPSVVMAEGGGIAAVPVVDPLVFYGAGHGGMGWGWVDLPDKEGRGDGGGGGCGGVGGVVDLGAAAVVSMADDTALVLRGPALVGDDDDDDDGDEREDGDGGGVPGGSGADRASRSGQTARTARTAQRTAQRSALHTPRSARTARSAHALQSLAVWAARIPPTLTLSSSPLPTHAAVRAALSQCGGVYAPWAPMGGGGQGGAPAATAAAAAAALGGGACAAARPAVAAYIGGALANEAAAFEAAATDPRCRDTLCDGGCATATPAAVAGDGGRTPTALRRPVSRATAVTPPSVVVPPAAAAWWGAPQPHHAVAVVCPRALLVSAVDPPVVDTDVVVSAGGDVLWEGMGGPPAAGGGAAPTGAGDALGRGGGGDSDTQTTTVAVAVAAAHGAVVVAAAPLVVGQVAVVAAPIAGVAACTAGDDDLGGGGAGDVGPTLPTPAAATPPPHHPACDCIPPLEAPPRAPTWAPWAAAVDLRNASLSAVVRCPWPHEAAGGGSCGVGGVGAMLSFGALAVVHHPTAPRLPAGFTGRPASVACIDVVVVLPSTAPVWARDAPPAADTRPIEAFDADGDDSAANRAAGVPPAARATPHSAPRPRPLGPQGGPTSPRPLATSARLAAEALDVRQVILEPVVFDACPPSDASVRLRAVGGPPSTVARAVPCPASTPPRGAATPCRACLLVMFVVPTPTPTRTPTIHPDTHVCGGMLWLLMLIPLAPLAALLCSVAVMRWCRAVRAAVAIDASLKHVVVAPHDDEVGGARGDLLGSVLEECLGGMAHMATHGSRRAGVHGGGRAALGPEAHSSAAALSPPAADDDAARAGARGQPKRKVDRPPVGASTSGIGDVYRGGTYPLGAMGSDGAARLSGTSAGATVPNLPLPRGGAAAEWGAVESSVLSASPAELRGWDGGQSLHPAGGGAADNDGPYRGAPFSPPPADFTASHSRGGGGGSGPGAEPMRRRPWRLGGWAAALPLWVGGGRSPEPSDLDCSGYLLRDGDVYPSVHGIDIDAVERVDTLAPPRIPSCGALLGPRRVVVQVPATGASRLPPPPRTLVGREALAAAVPVDVLASPSVPLPPPSARATVTPKRDGAVA